jgi:hypothetical protein
MPIDIKQSFNKFIEKTNCVPVVNEIFCNPFIAALILTCVIVIIILAIYQNTIILTNYKKSLKLIFYVYLASLSLMLIHYGISNHRHKIAHEIAGGSSYVSSVHSSNAKVSDILPRKRENSHGNSIQAMESNTLRQQNQLYTGESSLNPSTSNLPLPPQNPPPLDISIPITEQSISNSTHLDAPNNTTTSLLSSVPTDISSPLDTNKTTTSPNDTPSRTIKLFTDDLTTVDIPSTHVLPNSVTNNS